MVLNIAQKLTGILAPTSHNVSNGVSTGAKKVATVVRETEYATSAFERYEITLLVMAPGAAPVITNPRITMSGRCSARPIPSESNGIMVNWQRVPNSTASGDFRMFW